MEEKTQLEKWKLNGGKLCKRSRKEWKKNKKLQELYPYLNEEMPPTRIAFAKIIMIIVAVVIAYKWGKSAIERNILLPSTITNQVQQSENNQSFYSEEQVKKLVMDSLATQSVEISKQEVEVIKYVEITPTPLPYREVKGYYSWYYPPLGGINCDTNPDGSPECDYLANGDKWDKWENIGCACPVEIPFGTQIYIVELDLNLFCVDRGGAIVKENNGYYWIDHLTINPKTNWSTPITIRIMGGY